MGRPAEWGRAAVAPQSGRTLLGVCQADSSIAVVVAGEATVLSGDPRRLLLESFEKARWILEAEAANGWKAAISRLRTNTLRSASKVRNLARVVGCWILCSRVRDGVDRTLGGARR